MGRDRHHDRSPRPGYRSGHVAWRWRAEGDQMRDSSAPARLIRPWRARLLAVALPLSVALVAGCTGSSGTAASGAGAATARGGGYPGVESCERGPRDYLRARHGSRSRPRPCRRPACPRRIPAARCNRARATRPPVSGRVRHRALLDGGIDGRGETVTILVPAHPQPTADRYPSGLAASTACSACPPRGSSS